MSSTRRELLAAGLGLGLGLAAPRAPAGELVVGFIYVGPRNDFGYNQSHARAASKVADLPGVRVVEQERVPESDAVESVMEAMIVQDGARIVYPTSYGYYDPHVLRLARERPDVVFRHCGGRWREGDPPNVGSYFGAMHEGQFLAGFVAGAVAGGEALGFVASNRYPPVMRNVNAFALGARLASPGTETRVLFTGSWSDPVREAEAVNVLADGGARVFGCSVDSARSVLETARRRGLRACGYNASMAEIGGESYLTAAVSEWSAINLRTVRTVQEGRLPQNMFSGGLAEGVVDCDRPGPSVPSSVVRRMERVKSEVVSGERSVWQGPLRDSVGALRAAEGERIARDDPRLQKMDWFVRGVEG